MKISKFVNTVLGPVTKLFGFAKSFSSKMPGKSKKSKPEDEEETVDDEE